MKLSRKQLEDFIVGSMRDNGENGWGSEDEHSALEALRNDSLEIEGYERVEWIKFDPNNPKTFPPEDKMFLAFGSPDINVNYDDHEFTCWRNSVFSYSTNESGTPEIKYWRPLPPPPGKE